MSRAFPPPVSATRPRLFAAIAVTLLLCAAPAPVAGQGLPTESFDNVPSNYYRFGFTGDVIGTDLTVAQGIGEVINDNVGANRGNYYWMRLGYYAPTWDQAGYGTSTLRARSTFDLFAGTTYILRFDWSRQGFSAGNGPFPFTLTANLGSASLVLQDNAGFFFGENWQTATLSFTPTVSELGAIIAFSGIGQAYSGVFLDNISMVAVDAPPPPLPNVVPEPSSWLLMLSGGVALLLVSRRRRGMPIG